MSRGRRYVYRCPDCMTVARAIELTARGGKAREPFRDPDGHIEPGVRIVEVLCWWCRTMHSPAEVEACMAMPRPVAVTGEGSLSSSIAKMPPWLSQFPEIWEFLSKPSYADGTPRQLGKVSLGLVSDGVQMTLTDPSSSTYCSRHYKTVEDALLGFEIGLKEGSLTWRASGPPRAKKRP